MYHQMWILPKPRKLLIACSGDNPVVDCIESSAMQAGRFPWPSIHWLTQYFSTQEVSAIYWATRDMYSLGASCSEDWQRRLLRCIRIHCKSLYVIHTGTLRAQRRNRLNLRHLNDSIVDLLSCIRCMREEDPASNKSNHAGNRQPDPEKLSRDIHY